MNLKYILFSYKLGNNLLCEKMSSKEILISDRMKKFWEKCVHIESWQWK